MRVLEIVCGGATTLLSFVPALCIDVWQSKFLKFDSVFAGRPGLVQVAVGKALGRGKIRLDMRKE